MPDTSTSQVWPLEPPGITENDTEFGFGIISSGLAAERRQDRRRCKGILAAVARVAPKCKR